MVDETSLNGFYDFSLRWKTPDGEFLSWFDAVESQLGLRLDKRLVKADFLVIEHAEEPTEN